MNFFSPLRRSTEYCCEIQLSDSEKMVRFEDYRMTGLTKALTKRPKRD
jgi:hypothetical protein